MVEKINERKNEIKVKLTGGVGELCQYQHAIIELLQHYDHEDYNGGSAFYYALNLLSGLLPDEDVLQRGFISEGYYLELPENMTEQGREMIREAIFMIANPEVKVRQEANPIHQILISQQRN